MKFVINGVEVSLDDVMAAAEAKCSDHDEINLKKKQSEQTRSKSKSFVANVLEISSLRANIDILPSSESQIIVKVSGPKSMVDGVSIEQSGETVVVSKSRHSEDHTNTVIMNDSRIATHSGSIVINNGSLNFISSLTSDDDAIVIGSKVPPLKIEVALPKGAPITLRDIRGKVEIGKVDSRLYARLGGQAHVHAERLRPVIKADLSGQATLKVDHFDGNIDATASGQSGVTVSSGKIVELSATASGQSRVKIHATADFARLSASGQSRIKLDRCLHRPSWNSSGQSKISVGRIG